MLTLVERKARYSITSESPYHSAVYFTNNLENLKEFFGSKFNEVFKSITVTKL